MSFSSNLETKLFRYFSCTPYKLRMLSTSIGFRGRGRRHTGTYIRTFMAQHKRCAHTYIHMTRVMGHMFYMGAYIHGYMPYSECTTSTCCAGNADGREEQTWEFMLHTPMHIYPLECNMCTGPIFVHFAALSPSWHTRIPNTCTGTMYVCISVHFIGLLYNYVQYVSVLVTVYRAIVTPKTVTM